MKGNAITYIMLLTFTELMSPCLLNHSSGISVYMCEWWGGPFLLVDSESYDLKTTHLNYLKKVIIISS